MKEISGDISATYIPSLPKKIWYLLYNLGRGILGGFSLVRTTHWQPEALHTENDHSPMRVLSDAAFAYFISKHITEKNISVLDIGSGSGYLREQLASLGYGGQYTGVDVYTHRAYSNDAVRAFDSELVLSAIEDFTPQKTYDLVMSVTALEHIPDDFKAVEVASNSTGQTGTQIHIVPGFWSLFIYLLHGYRQYTRRRLGKLFKGQSYKIHRLGGLPSFLVHLCCITIPERILHIHVRQRPFYPKLVNRAIKLDRYLPIFGYAFVIIVNK